MWQTTVECKHMHWEMEKSCDLLYRYTHFTLQWSGRVWGGPALLQAHVQRPTSNHQETGQPQCWGTSLRRCDPACPMRWTPALRGPGPPRPLDCRCYLPALLPEAALRTQVQGHSLEKVMWDWSSLIAHGTNPVKASVKLKMWGAGAEIHLPCCPPHRQALCISPLAY